MPGSPLTPTLRLVLRVGEVYFDRTFRDAPWLGEDRDTADFDIHHSLLLFGLRYATWGLGYRWTRGRFDNTSNAQIFPRTKADQIANPFSQDGIHLLKDAVTRNIPVVFVSGMLDGRTRSLALSSGVAGFVGKPFQKEELLRTVQAALVPVFHLEKVPRPAQTSEGC
jgi:hypothetical protein